MPHAVGESCAGIVSGNLDGMKDGAARRYVEIGVVGMEIGAAVGETQRLALRVAPVRQNKDVGIVRVVKLVDHMGFWFPKPSREVNEALRRQFLIADHQDQMLMQGLLDDAKVVVADVVEVDSRKDAAASLRQRANDRFRHVSSPCLSSLTMTTL
jgi:hypothetical protein